MITYLAIDLYTGRTTKMTEDDFLDATEDLASWESVVENDGITTYKGEEGVILKITV